MKVLLWLFEPSARIVNPEDRFKARVFTVLLLSQTVSIAFFLVLLLSHSHLMEAGQKENQRLSLIVSTALMCGLYVASRTRHYSRVAMGYVALNCYNITGAILGSPNAQTVAGASIWYGMGVIVASLVLSARVAWSSALVTAGCFGYLATQLGRDVMPYLMSAAIYVACSSILIIVTHVLRERTERQLQTERATALHAAKLSTLGEMAGGIAHEINTPLGAMILNAEMIQMRNEDLTAPDPEIARRAATIQDVGGRVSKIIRGLKGVARDAKGDERRDFTLGELVESTTDLCREKFKGHGVDLRIGGSALEWPVHGQIIQLSQTLLNLLNNAYDAVQGSAQKWISIEARPCATGVELRVADSGGGIAPEVVARLFTPFFTTKAVGQGTGLGLSISRGIVAQHGGELVYDGAEGATCFAIRLPLARKEAA